MLRPDEVVGEGTTTPLESFLERVRVAGGEGSCVLVTDVVGEVCEELARLAARLKRSVSIYCYKTIPVGHKPLGRGLLLFEGR